MHQNRVEDPELTELGQKQAKALAAYVAMKLNITHLYTSLMVRSVATADAVRQRVNLQCVAWPEVHECMGIFLRNEKTGVMKGLPGKARSFFESQFPHLKLPDNLNEDGWWNRPVETKDQWAIRARSFLIELKRRHPDENHRLAIITHGDFYREILRTLLGITQTSTVFFQFSNTAILNIEFSEGSIKIKYLNRIDHLLATDLPS